MQVAISIKNTRGKSNPPQKAAKHLKCLEASTTRTKICIPLLSISTGEREKEKGGRHLSLYT